MRRVVGVTLGAAIFLGTWSSPDFSRVQEWFGASRSWAGEAACRPTAPDSEGPFYTPNAPERSSIGRGLVVTGVVRTAGSCAPVPRARIELNPNISRNVAKGATGGCSLPTAIASPPMPAGGG